MKQLLVVLFIALASCNQPAPRPQRSFETDSLSAKIEELKEKYKPGLGEIMAGIQMHHAKLWFAGINNNWKLSEYEIKEIKERIEQAKDIESNRPEMKDIPIIYAAIDSIAKAIQQKNTKAFKLTFQELTNTCNSCHKTVHFEFNVVTTPTQLPVTNQDFKAHPEFGTNK